MNLLKKPWYHIRNFDKYIGSILLFSMVILVVSQVVVRTFFHSSFVASVDLAQYFLICIVFISAPYAARTNGHIKMTELRSYLPKKIQQFLRICSCIGAVIIFAIITYSAIYTTARNLHTNATSTLSIPFWLFFLPTILGFLLLTVEYLFILYKEIILKNQQNL